MVLSTLSCEKILLTDLSDVPKNEISLVFATHFGEVTSTLDFLGGPNASPILFQNSLHNSSLGFATLNLGLTGPAMTINADQETMKAGHEMVDTLLELTPYVMLCFVDLVPEALKSTYIQTHPFVKNFLNKATCTLWGRA